MLKFRPRIFPAAAALLASLLPAAAEVWFRVSLPTPREHYKTYNADAEALKLMGNVMADLDPDTRKLVMEFMAGGAETEALPPVPPEQAKKMVEAMGLRKYKPEFLELLLHKSQVLDVIPEKSREELIPVVHDALLAFLDGLSEDRLVERAIPMLRQRKDATRGDQILLLASRIPTLQKLGQIVARLEGIPPDIQRALQSLENEISTTPRDELVEYIVSDVGQETIDKYQVRFAGKVLAEASVGAVIRATFVDPSSGEEKEIVCKIVKPYAQTGLPEELEIIDAIIGLYDRNEDFYNIGDLPLRDMFEDIRAALAEEIRVTEEQAHFRTAFEYYRGQKGVTIPRVYEFSTQNATFMDFLNVEKITGAFPGDSKRRAKLGRHLLDVMSYRTLWAKPDTAIFHGDPHAGNVMHVVNHPKNPYQLALLDWGLLGTLPKQQRQQLVQLALSMSQRRAKGLRRNVGSLIRGGMPQDPQKVERIYKLLDDVLEETAGRKLNTFEAFQAILEKLVMAGYPVDSRMSLYIKSQVTLAGIFRELDPSLNQDKYLKKRVSRQVLKELPKRLLLLPAWHYRGYRSMLSNGDVLGEVFH